MQYTVKQFADGQFTCKLGEVDFDKRGYPNYDLEVKIRGNSYEDLFKAATIKNAYDRRPRTALSGKSILYITCLIGQRSDKRFNSDESFDLEVVANFINSMNFDYVYILHPHSDVTLGMIKNVIEWKADEFMIKAFNDVCTPTSRPVIISPDAGAYKRTYGVAEQLDAEFKPSNKVRISAPLIEFNSDVTGKDCIILDDILCGGRTFIALAKVLKEKGAKRVFLYVTHCMAHWGFEEMKECIDHVYCTNSYRDINDPYVTQFKVI